MSYPPEWLQSRAIGRLFLILASTTIAFCLGCQMADTDTQPHDKWSPAFDNDEMKKTFNQYQAIVQMSDLAIKKGIDHGSVQIDSVKGQWKYAGDNVVVVSWDIDDKEESHDADLESNIVRIDQTVTGRIQISGDIRTVDKDGSNYNSHDIMVIDNLGQVLIWIEEDRDQTFPEKDDHTATRYYESKKTIQFDTSNCYDARQIEQVTTKNGVETFDTHMFVSTDGFVKNGSIIETSADGTIKMFTAKPGDYETFEWVLESTTKPTTPLNLPSATLNTLGWPSM